ncbi:MAG TPA: alpha/beta hydrolase-fold protein [Terriglobales bacterium]|nr:alpha/beta hydrolase-fold protein [Terriglobales bacterium]
MIPCLHRNSNSGKPERILRCGILYLCAALVACSLGLAQDKLGALDLLRLAKSGGPELAQGVTKTFSAIELEQGTAWKGHLSSFFFAITTPASSKPALMIDGTAGPEMQQIPNSSLWYASAEVSKLGAIHSFYYVVQGKRVGGSTDLPAFGPLAYLQLNVPSGTLSQPLLHTSKIYDGLQTTYWTYVPARYDPKVPAALMVFQDGQWYMDRDGNIPLLNVLDNLIAQKKIPVIVCVFVSPGKIGNAPGTPTYAFAKAYADKWHRQLEDAMRSTLYDTVSDRYPRFLRDELLLEVEAKYNIRKDAYSRGIMGLSSGGISSFNAAWQMPDQFSRVISWIGSFTSIQWRENPENLDGGQDYPEKVLHETKRNIRVWLQDGSRDLQFGSPQRNYGNWPAANFRLANALKAAGYDFHFSFGEGSHNGAHGAVELPEELIWLWRDYDPAKTQQNYEQDTDEQAKPPFRFTLVDRDVDRDLGK